MAKVNKKNVEIANKLVEDLPVELQDIILLKTFDKLAKRCYDDPEYLNICSSDKELICKHILLDSDFTVDINNWLGKYRYLVKHLLVIVELISKSDGVKVKIENKTKITNYVNGPRIFELSESEYNKIPEDVINFVLKNGSRKVDDPEVYSKDGKAYIAIKNGNLKELNKLLKKNYIPIGVKNDLVRLAIEKYNNEPHIGNIMDSLNNRNMILVEELAQSGASKYVIMDEFKKRGNMVFYNMYNSPPRTLLGRLENLRV